MEDKKFFTLKSPSFLLSQNNCFDIECAFTFTYSWERRIEGFENMDKLKRAE